jgi:L-alanine-DL-glutamate epimerase-like enolase superfamily enzyme
VTRGRSQPSPVVIERVRAFPVTFPTDEPEQDGTISWDSTTIVLVEVEADGIVGVGYTYGDPVTAELIRSKLAGPVCGSDAMAVAGIWRSLQHAVRNIGRPGLCAHAISAVDIALWDLKARLLEKPLAALLGLSRERVPVYGSGGFTSYSNDRMARQLGTWSSSGFGAVKMKVGADAAVDRDRVRIARDAIGPACELFVDANGAYERKQALALATEFADLGVTWFEEPVSSDDLEGLRLLRDRAPGGMRIAAGEYGYDGGYFRRMLEAGAVDVVQADATRCLGLSGFLQAAGLADAFQLPISAHTAPAVHLHACCAVGKIAPLEWFHDHARIEAALFDGAPRVIDGTIAPDPERPGLGLDLNREQLERHAA